MKIQVKTIRTEGLEVSEVLDHDWTGLTGKDSIHFIDAVTVNALITRVEDELIVSVTAASRYETFCYRCLEDLKRDWKAAFALSFDIEKNTEFIEITEDLRQELILHLPTRLLCAHDCKGLCVDCGANLNKKNCEHMHSVVSGQ